MPRLQAIRKLLRLNPNPEFTVSKAVQNTFNPTRTKFLTISEQESHHDSSEDTNVLKFFENFGNEEHNSPIVPIHGHGVPY